jgi:hypothetical protein
LFNIDVIQSSFEIWIEIWILKKKVFK